MLNFSWNKHNVVTALVLHVYFSNDIPIHAPREGGDGPGSWGTIETRAFQSTPPVRGATADKLAAAKRGEISIHAVLLFYGDPSISIHAPLTGGDFLLHVKPPLVL